jgi:hypothetical protein
MASDLRRDGDEILGIGISRSEVLATCVVAAAMTIEVASAGQPRTASDGVAEGTRIDLLQGRQWIREVRTVFRQQLMNAVSLDRQIGRVG